MHDPAEHIARAGLPVESGGRIVGFHPAVSVRLGVTNKRRQQAAEGVEVLVEEVEPLEAAVGLSAQEWSEATHRHHLGPLGWTHDERPALAIGAGASRSLDLGQLGAGSRRFNLGIRVLDGEPWYELLPGKHRITLVVGGVNYGARRYGVTLEFKPWKPDDDLHECVKITSGPSLLPR